MLHTLLFISRFKSLFQVSRFFKNIQAGALICLQKIWGLTVTCTGQSLNPAVTYSAFLHSSRVMILLKIVNFGARLRARHFTVHFLIQKPVSSQQICWKYLSRCFDFFCKKVGVCRLLVVVNQLTRLLPILRFCTVVGWYFTVLEF